MPSMMIVLPCVRLPGSSNDPLPLEIVSHADKMSWVEKMQACATDFSKVYKNCDQLLTKLEALPGGRGVLG